MNIHTISRMAAQPTVAFIILMGVVSLFADMTHEGARSIYGAYLPLLGLSATMIGFVTGLGEFIGYALRLLTGIIADKSRNYWGMTMLGYGINVIAIPTLALVPENGWMLACMLIILERTGKAIRQPAKNTLLSYASSQVGLGKGFAVQEFLDQMGAFLGPVLLFCVLWLKNGENSLGAYAACFAALTIPALLTMFFLLKARRTFPHPELFEQDTEIDLKYKTRKRFLLYILAIGCFALGFVDFPLITMHVAKLQVIPADTLPLLYAGAMLVDAFAALVFGWLFDRIHFQALIISGLLAAFFAVFIFFINTAWGVIIGIILWGIGMGAQESILKSAVVTLTPRENRSTSFGIFESCFGLCWFLGSWLMGWLYDTHPTNMVLFSVIMQLVAIPFYAFLHVGNIAQEES